MLGGSGEQVWLGGQVCASGGDTWQHSARPHLLGNLLRSLAPGLGAALAQLSGKVLEPATPPCLLCRGRGATIVVRSPLWERRAPRALLPKAKASRFSRSFPQPCHQPPHVPSWLFGFLTSFWKPLSV